MYELYDNLEAQREALVSIHVKVQNLTGPEYNAIVKAIWRIDRHMREMREMEQQNV